MEINPGILTLSLIYVCFMTEDGRIPLYKIPEYLRSLDLFLLLENPYMLMTLPTINMVAF
jgi:hypothetical protein